MKAAKGLNRPKAMVATNPNAPKTTDTKEYFPIALLTNFQYSWRIKARVLMKGDMKEFKKKDGSLNHLMNIEIMDKDETMIACTFFGTDVCSKYNDLLKEHGTYTFSEGKVGLANRKYTSIAHHYQITFNERAEIEVAEEDTSIPTKGFNFKKISQLNEMQSVGTFVDFLG
jgi:replication factor A1